MKSPLRSSVLLFVFGALVFGVAVSGTGVAHAAVLQQPAAEAAPAQPNAEHPQTGKSTSESEFRKENKEIEQEENAEFKQSPVVKKLASLTGMGPKTAYWIFVFLNFAILVAFFWWLLVKKMSIGAIMRERTAMIQKGMEDARKASAEANARLGNIEARLQRLDSEVASLRSSAEADFLVEESRIKQATGEETRRVVQSAEQEIVAAAKAARHDLKAFAAALAVELASKRISVDAATDQRLVSNFVDQLGVPAGRDGK